MKEYPCVHIRMTNAAKAKAHKNLPMPFQNGTCRRSASSVPNNFTVSGLRGMSALLIQMRLAISDRPSNNHGTQPILSGDNWALD